MWDSSRLAIGSPRQPVPLRCPRAPADLLWDVRRVWPVYVRLEAELQRGPLAHGFADDQRWTLKRIKR